MIRTGIAPAAPPAAARTARAGRRAPAVATAHKLRWGFAEWFILSQTALPALLYLPGTQSIRLPIRVSAFAISLAAFGWWLVASKTRVPAHRVYSWVAAIMALLGIMIFHPSTSSLVGGFAHTMLYLAVMAPVFWAAVMVRDPDHLARIIAILLVCSGINSVVGVLQVYDPGRWMPAELSRMLTESAHGLGPVTYTGPDGRLIVRPPGLFDTPGAVAGPGMFAALFGAVFAASALSAWKRMAAGALAIAGVAAIYLSQVRVSLVIVVLMFGVYAFALLRQRKVGRATMFGGAAAAMVVASFVLAVGLGGESVTSRVMTLFEKDPLSVYYQSRGSQLDYTLTELLYQFPLGAGLARWGMVSGYFGSSAVPGLWAEIQITGWMIDGGVPLIFLYLGALVIVGQSALRLVSRSAHPKLAACAAVVLAANVGVAVMVVSFTPFVTQIGVQYWFLAGALHGVASRAGVPDA